MGAKGRQSGEWSSQQPEYYATPQSCIQLFFSESRNEIDSSGGSLALYQFGDFPEIDQTGGDFFPFIVTTIIP